MAKLEEADIQQPVWSKTQVSAFKECARKGFLSSHLKSLPSADAALVDQVERLKKMKNRHLWVSSTVHEAIGETLKTMRQGQPAPSAAELLDQTKNKMREQFKNSKALVMEDRLFEHEYERKLDPQVWQRHWDTVEKSLTWFMNSKWRERLQALGPECWKIVDEVLNFEVSGIKAYCKIDCAVEIDGRFFLIDWKTSALRPEDEASMQVTALYAHEVWGAEPDAILAHTVSLTDGKSMVAQVNEESLMETMLRIQEESAFLDSAVASIGHDPFLIPKASNIDTCQRCNFQQVCHPHGLT